MLNFWVPPHKSDKEVFHRDVLSQAMAASAETRSCSPVYLFFFFVEIAASYAASYGWPFAIQGLSFFSLYAGRGRWLPQVPHFLEE